MWRLCIHTFMNLVPGSCSGEAATGEKLVDNLVICETERTI